MPGKSRESLPQLSPGTPLLLSVTESSDAHEEPRAVAEARPQSREELARSSRDTPERVETDRVMGGLVPNVQQVAGVKTNSPCEHPESLASFPGSKSQRAVGSRMNKEYAELPQAERQSVRSTFGMLVEQSERRCCGQTRRNLRSTFNLQEINVVRTMKKYAETGRSVLGPRELVPLLADFAEGVQPMESDIAFVFQVADVDRDGVISCDEVLGLLKLWYCYKHFPEAVDDCLSKHLPANRSMSEEDVCSLLQDLNDFKPVSVDEGAFVRNIAHMLGGTDTVSRDHMKKAVAAWYLNIERDRTGNQTLALQTMDDMRRDWGTTAKSLWDRGTSTVALASGQNDLGESRLSQSTHDIIPQHDLLMLGFFSIVGTLIGIWMTSVSVESEHKETCESDLNTLLYWKGIVTCVFFLIVMMALASVAGGRENWTWISGEPNWILLMWLVIAQIVFFIIGMLQGVYGIYAVASSSVTGCGAYLYHVNWFVFVGAPVFIVPSILCCVVALCFAMQMAQARSIDRDFGA